MLLSIYYCVSFVFLIRIQSSYGMILLNKNSSFSSGKEGNNAIAEFIIAQGYLPNEEDLPKKAAVPNNDNDVNYVLSKLSDDELIKLLNEEPNKRDFNLNDLIKIGDAKKVQNFKTRLDKDKGKGETSKQFSSLNGLLEESAVPKSNIEKSKPASAVFRLNNKDVDPFSFNTETDPEYVAVQKLQNVLYSRPSEIENENHDNDDDRRELLFDVLIAQLKSLCCKKSKSSKRKDTKKNYDNSMLDHPVPKINRPKSFASKQPNEHMFLIFNEEINNHGSDGLISVDPDSLGKNSTVLLLGPVTSQLDDTQLKIAMTRIESELSKPEYEPLLQQLSDGTIGDENIRLVNSLVTGPETRRYIKPHRCNHQSKLAKVYGGPKWLICTGYLNLNTPSLYD